MANSNCVLQLAASVDYEQHLTQLIIFSSQHSSSLGLRDITLSFPSTPSVTVSVSSTGCSSPPQSFNTLECPRVWSLILLFIYTHSLVDHIQSHNFQ